MREMVDDYLDGFEGVGRKCLLIIEEEGVPGYVARMVSLEAVGLLSHHL